MDNGKSVSMVMPMAGMLGWVIKGPFHPKPQNCVNHQILWF